MAGVDLTLRLVPLRVYPTVKSWDLFPTVNGTSSLINQIGDSVSMPASCNRTRVYIAGLCISEDGAAFANTVGHPDLVLKGFDNQDQKMCEIPVGIHIFVLNNNATTAKTFPMPTGYSEDRMFNQSDFNVGPQTYTQRRIRYGWTARGGEFGGLDAAPASSPGGVSDAKDNLLITGQLFGGTNSDGFGSTVAPWLIEAPVARWKLDGKWNETAGGAVLGFGQLRVCFVVFCLFVGEQV